MFMNMYTIILFSSITLTMISIIFTLVLSLVDQRHKEELEIH